jgi:hypothetical protein
VVFQNVGQFHSKMTLQPPLVRGVYQHGFVNAVL